MSLSIRDPEKFIRIIKRRNISPDYLAEVREKYEHPRYYEPKQYKNNSRYTNLRRLFDSESGKFVHETPRQLYVKLSDDDEYFTVTKTEEDRFDIISNYYYDTPRYWWVIAVANYWFDPFYLPVGTRLRIPPLMSLYSEGGVISG